MDGDKSRNTCNLIDLRSVHATYYTDVFLQKFFFFFDFSIEIFLFSFWVRQRALLYQTD